ncbi:MAG: FeoB-associated Cys-rich membrane protein [Clostridia bacterium]|nr:FeoB-associated Cys-rich membrane protein [Clostridia bacterium]
MKNIIVIAIIIVILGLAIGYIIKAKKSGARCIGCPSGGKCSCGCSDCKNEKQ